MGIHFMLLQLSVCLSLQAAAAPNLKFVYRVSEIANLTRHLDCLAGAVQCADGLYQQAWKEGWSAEDEAAIAQWKVLMDSYRGESIDVDGADALPGVHLNEHQKLVLFHKIRTVALESDSLDEWAHRLELVMLTRDAERLVAIARRFAPRFHRNWQQKAEAFTTQFAVSFERAFEQAKLGQRLEQAAHFTGAQIAHGHRVVFHFNYRPDSHDAVSYAEPLDNHISIEIDKSSKPEDIIPIAMHEVFHHFYALANAEQHQVLVERFAKSEDSMAFGYFNLLNEALATSFGNGLVAKAVDPQGFAKDLTTAESFVADSFKDRAAKAILLVLDQALLNGTAITDEAFVKSYLQQVRIGLKELSDSPLLLLRIGLAGFADEAVHRQVALLSRRIAPVQFVSYLPLDGEFLETLHARAEQSAALIVRPQDLKLLSPLKSVLGVRAFNQLMGSRSRSTPYLFVSERSSKAKLFVFVGRTDEEFAKLFDAFVTAPRIGIGLIELFSPRSPRVNPVIH